MSAGFARRFRATPGRLVDAIETVRAIIADPRFATLGGRAQSWVLVMAAKLADADGKWHVKHETEASYLGCSTDTAGRAARAVEASGLTSATPYVRLDGLQGASIYALDPALVRRSGESAMATRGGKGAMATRHGESAAPERVSNGVSNEFPLTPLTGGKTRSRPSREERREERFGHQLSATLREAFENLPDERRGAVVECYHRSTGLRLARGDPGISWRVDPLGTDRAPKGQEASQLPPSSEKATPDDFLEAWLERERRSVA